MFFKVMVRRPSEDPLSFFKCRQDCCPNGNIVNRVVEEKMQLVLSQDLLSALSETVLVQPSVVCGKESRVMERRMQLIATFFFHTSRLRRDGLVRKS